MKRIKVMITNDEKDILLQDALAKSPSKRGSIEALLKRAFLMFSFHSLENGIGKIAVQNLSRSSKENYLEFRLKPWQSEVIKRIRKYMLENGYEKRERSDSAILRLVLRCYISYESIDSDCAPLQSVDQLFSCEFAD